TVRESAHAAAYRHRDQQRARHPTRRAAYSFGLTQMAHRRATDQSVALYRGLGAILTLYRNRAGMLLSEAPPATPQSAPQTSPSHVPASRPDTDATLARGCCPPHSPRAGSEMTMTNRVEVRITHRIPFAESHAFGDVGAYERLSGRVY